MSNRSAFSFLVVAILIVAIGVWVWLTRRKVESPSDRPEDDGKASASASGGDARIRLGDLFLAPATESKARAERVLPSRGSEDVSHLLAVPTAGTISDAATTTEYGPGGLEWVVDIVLPEETTVTTEAIDQAFGQDWVRNEGATFYGRSSDDGRWTYMHAAGVPKVWSQVAVTVDLVKTYRDAPAPASAERLERLLHDVRERAKELSPSKVEPRSSPKAGEDLGVRMLRCWQGGKGDSIVVLAAPEGRSFDGRQVWDVMLSLGLRWGDMDLFHWNNDSDLGDDYLFSVWTTTSPGYFLPEEIAAGQMSPETLVFGFSVPRTVAPEHVREQMMKAARYAQNRLGGELLGEDGQRLDESSERARILRIESALDEAGLQPGRDTTLRLF